MSILATSHVVLGEIKTKSGKNLFKKLNEHSKNLQVRQEEIAKKHNSLASQYKELERLKNNMNEYMGNEKTLEMQPKKSIIKQIGDMSERGQKACNKKVKNRENER